MWKQSIAIAGLAALCFACGGGEEAQNKAVSSEARKAEWSWLDGAQKELTALRQQAATLAGQATPEATAQLATLQPQIDAKTDELGRRLVEYINADPPIQGEPMTPEQVAAFRLKSAADRFVAREFIDKGGDYRRALDILKAAAAVDPDNPTLKSAIAEAEANRLVTPERFALVKNGMTPEEVRQVVGPVYLRNVKEYPDKGIVSWFYPTADDGHAAAVYFHKKGESLVVYQATFDAVKPGGAAGEEG